MLVSLSNIYAQLLHIRVNSNFLLLRLSSKKFLLIMSKLLFPFACLCTEKPRLSEEFLHECRLRMIFSSTRCYKSGFQRHLHSFQENVKLKVCLHLPQFLLYGVVTSHSTKFYNSNSLPNFH